MLSKRIWISHPKSLEIIVTTKDIKSLILKYKEGQYHLSKPKYISDDEAIKWLESLDVEQFEKLASKEKIKQNNQFVYIFGHKYQLHIYDMNKKKVSVRGDDIYVYHKKYLDTYLRELLKAYIEKRIEIFDLVDFNVKVEIQKMSRKLGCCFYTQQRVKFASRLIHEDKAVIDSIIIHELAHFYYPNHGKAFYQFVRAHDLYYDRNIQLVNNGGVGDDPIRE